MAIFNKTRAGSYKHSIVEVIQYDGPNDVLIWRHPNENFNTRTQLVVGPSQEVIFVKGGQVLERFVSGTYTLSTSNYPFVRGLVSMVSGGASPFTCSVYYINKVVSMAIEWGTDSPIPIVDPIYQIPVDVRSYGDFSIRVDNGKKLLEKVVGTSGGFSHDELKKYFANLMGMQIRGVISGCMLANHLSPIGIDAKLADLSIIAAEKIKPIFEQYGIELIHFTIASITAPELAEIKEKSRKLQVHRMETDMSVEDTQKKAQASAFEKREMIDAEAYGKREMAKAQAFETTELTGANAFEKREMAKAQAFETTELTGADAIAKREMAKAQAFEDTELADSGAYGKREMAKAQAFENQQLGISEQDKAIAAALSGLATNPGPMMGGGGMMPGGMGYPGFIGGAAIQPSSAGTAEMAKLLLHQKTEEPMVRPVEENNGIMPGMGMMEEERSLGNRNGNDFEERVKKLKFLRENGMISQEQYDETMARILAEI